ncbi:MAG TPA: methionine synthase [Mycobacteriales bacterium]|nr:methionine synthase [Mycobacteriales bacterium]
MGAVLTGVATGVGSLPGTDIDAAVATCFDQLPDLPHLPELPGRGPGADMVGRTGAQLAGLGVDRTPSGWRLVDRPGLDQRAAQELLEADLDALLPVAAPGYDGALKLQLTGPWTLAASLDLPRGGAALGDAGAVRDLVASLAETAKEHVADVRRRLPAAELVLQLDEPSLPAVLAGRVRTQSGLGTLRVPEESAVVSGLAEVIDAVGVPVAVHCCVQRPPIQLFRSAGAAAVGVDLTVGEVEHDALGELIEGGGVVWLGVVPSLGPGVPPVARDVAEPVRGLWRELGFDSDALPRSIAVTPSCGLAGASPGWATTAYRLLGQVARALSEAPEGVR